MAQLIKLGPIIINLDNIASIDKHSEEDKYTLSFQVGDEIVVTPNEYEVYKAVEVFYQSIPPIQDIIGTHMLVMVTHTDQDYY